MVFGATAFAVLVAHAPTSTAPHQVICDWWDLTIMLALTHAKEKDEFLSLIDANCRMGLNPRMKWVPLTLKQLRRAAPSSRSS